MQLFYFICRKQIGMHLLLYFFQEVLGAKFVHMHNLHVQANTLTRQQNNLIKIHTEIAYQKEMTTVRNTR